MTATFGRCVSLVLAALLLAVPAHAQTSTKLGPLLEGRLSNPVGRSLVIVGATDDVALATVELLIDQLGGTRGRRLPLINATVADLPNTAVWTLANNSLVSRIALDRRIRGSMHRTSETVGSATIREQFGYDGSGIGVAVIDSGVTAWHDDLTRDANLTTQRVERFVDFVNGATSAYDDFGHGTHVAGIIAGNGFDSNGARAGIAPRAGLYVLKVLDHAGRGRISDVIAALGYVVENRSALGIRVVNLSIGAGVYESYTTDFLTIAAKRAVDAGLVVVASAGNFGKDPRGRPLYGGITAPGNAPWVLTVGASSHMGTVDRADDTIASFSSRGPTAIDRGAKPDLVAPGVGIESLSDPGSLLFTTKPALLLNGTVATEYPPYLSLSGTSQSAPVVSGVVALMLQANPTLNPNAVKAILQYSAQPYPGYDVLTQGAGFLNARGAVELARFLAAPLTLPYPSMTGWGRQLLWGNNRVRPGYLTSNTNAWQPGVVWGASHSAQGNPLVWNSMCPEVGCLTESVPDTTVTSTVTSLLFGSPPPPPPGPTVSVLPSDNVVWGSLCGGSNCSSATAWTPDPNVVYFASDGDTVVWGSTDDGDTVVWGSTDTGDTVVWGSSDSGDTVVWGSSDSGDTVVWGSSQQEDVVWGESGTEPDHDLEEPEPGRLG